MQQGPKQNKKPGYDQKRIGAASDAGPVRQANEDAFFVPGQGVDTRLGAIYIVADGVGGQEHGRDAADLAVQTIPTNFYQLRQGGSDISQSLSYALEQANQIIYGESQRRETGRMSCTVVAAVQHRDQLFIAHAGDARAYLAQKGKLKLLTRDHSWVQDQVEAGTITPEEASAHELRNVVTRVLGNEPDVEVELSGPYQVGPADVLMLCSDGLYDVVSQTEIYKALSGLPPGQAAGKLVRTAVRAGAHDNVTAVVAAVGRSKEPGFNTLLTYPLPGGIPLFLPFVLSIIIISLALLLVLGNLDRPGASNAIQPNPTNAVLLATIPAGGPALMTAASIITNSAFITATGTITPTEPPGALLETAPSPTPSGVFTSTGEMYGCVESGSYLWLNSLYEDTGRLCEDTEIEWPIDRNALLLTDLESPVTIPGQAGGGSCDDAEFIQVRSIQNNNIFGWVNAVNVEPLRPGQVECNED